MVLVRLVMEAHNCLSRKFAPVVLILAILAGCDSRSEDQKEKPANVPQTAVWVGGADGGVYIHSSQASEEITIYSENGEVWYSGKTVLTEEQLQNVTGWDGTTLYFKDGDTVRLIE